MRLSATPAEVEGIEKVTGITPDDDLKAMWFSNSNGSGSQPWFLCDPEENRKRFYKLVDESKFDAESFRAFNLYSTDEVIKWWSIFKDIDEQNPNEWSTNSPDSFAPQKLDKRIGPQMLL